jgi:hypothetical protein
MSADYWMIVDLYDCEGTPVPADRMVGQWEITYNLGQMLKAAGFLDWKVLRNMTGREAAPVLGGVLDALQANPVRYQAMNPPNGWGSYDGLLKDIKSMHQACLDFPTGVFDACL